MDDNNSDFTESPSRREPAWVSAALSLLPTPVFAWTLVCGCLIASGIFVIQALIHGDSIYWVVTAILLCTSFVVSGALIIRAWTHRSTSPSREMNRQKSKPTFAIVVLLVGIYAWLMTVALHIFDGFFRNGPGSTKYYITLTIAIVASVFMKWRGHRIIKQHFSDKGAKNLRLTGPQAIVVAAVVIAVGVYGTWLMI